MQSTITGWGEAFMTSLTAALAMFFAAIPKVLGFAVILVAGWFIASAVEKILVRVLHAVHFNSLADRSGLSQFIQKTNTRTDASGMIAGVAKWFVRLIALVVAFDALGLPAVSDVLQQLLMWLPNLVVAMVALVIGGLAANAVGRLVRGAAAEGGLDRPDFLAKVAKTAVWAFAIVIAVNQIGIATTLVNTLFMATVGAVALALGLSFGIGGRDTAGTIVRKWYATGREKAPQIERAANAAGRMAEQRSSGADTRQGVADRRSGMHDRRRTHGGPSTLQ